MNSRPTQKLKVSIGHWETNHRQGGRGASEEFSIDKILAPEVKEVVRTGQDQREIGHHFSGRGVSRKVSCTINLPQGETIKGKSSPKKGIHEGAAPLASSDRRELDSQIGRVNRFCYLWATRTCAKSGMLRHLVCANPLSRVV